MSDRYQRIRSIGKGTFGEVYLVKNIDNKRQYAMKQLRVDERNKSRTKASVLREAKILAELKHPNIVAYQDSFFDDAEEHLFIVQDYCDAGTLDERIMETAKRKLFLEEKQIMQLQSGIIKPSFIKRYSFEYSYAVTPGAGKNIRLVWSAQAITSELNSQQIWNGGLYASMFCAVSWFIQITMAVQYIHSKKILHRDLKSQNVFMNKKGNTCKLGDFGISKTMSTTIDVASTCVGTPSYLSPEMCQDIPYSSKADIWALGCLLYEMCALKPAFDANNLVSLIYKIVKGTYDPVPDTFSPMMSELVQRILQKDPEKRPSAGQILNLDYVKSVLSEFIAENQHTSVTTAKHQTTVLGNRLSPISVHAPFTRPRELPSLSPSKGQSIKARDHNKMVLNRIKVEGCLTTVKNSAIPEPIGVDYEDDFEPDDIDSDSDDGRESIADDQEGSNKDKSYSGAADDDEQYYDDFEEDTSDQELENVVSHALQVHQSDWTSADDITIIDDEGPVDIRQLIKPHCEAAVGREKFKALTSKPGAESGAKKEYKATRWSSPGEDNHKETFYLIEELFAHGDHDT